MHGGVFRESYSLPLHKSQMFFRMVMGPINSEIYFLTITRAFYLPWDMRTLWSQKCNYFTYHCWLSWKKIWNTEKMIESEYKRFLCDDLIQSSAWRVHNWSLRSSFDRVGRRLEFQQISELWIRVDYLHAKCQKRFRVIRKSKEALRKHHLHIYGSL